MQVLFVCLGNICRSPIAEGVLKKYCREQYLDWKIHSSGLESYHIGEAPHRYSQKVCQKHGVDISQQKARQFVAADLQRFDKIYAMSQDVFNHIKTMAGAYFNSEQVILFLNELYPGQNQSVPDPWYGDESGYEPVFEMIDKTCQKIVAKYK